MEQKIEKKVKCFTCLKYELERIDEGLNHRNLDADSVISITDNGDFVTVWYRELQTTDKS